MRRAITALMLAAAMVLAMAPAAMAVQPTQVSNADGRTGGASEPGPHCHFNLQANENNSSAHGMILTGANHEAHTRTGLADSVFQATACA